MSSTTCFQHKRVGEFIRLHHRSSDVCHSRYTVLCWGWLGGQCWGDVRVCLRRIPFWNHWSKVKINQTQFKYIAVVMFTRKPSRKFMVCTCVYQSFHIHTVYRLRWQYPQNIPVMCRSWLVRCWWMFHTMQLSLFTSLMIQLRRNMWQVSTKDYLSVRILFR